MIFSRARIFLAGLSVISLGIVLGTFLWLKVGPVPGHLGWDAKPLEGFNLYGAVPDFANGTKRQTR